MARTLIVGDVHGCARELDTLLRRARPKRVVLVGDLFTRGPDPRGVWSLIREWDCEAVLGNHDAQVLDRWRPGRRLPREAHAWLARRPHVLVEKRWAVAHAGVHPRRGPRKTTRDQAMHLGRMKRGRWWWDLYEGRRLVVHGHHAAKGLIDRRPSTLGLDTGCVRGGRLTGYLVEDDRVVSVKARRDYTA